MLEAFKLSNIWTSAKRPNGGAKNEFYWTHSGKSLVYTNWRDGQPYRGANDSDCVAISKDFDYKWDDNTCKYMHITALCEW